jgi:hypothetical protein
VDFAERNFFQKKCKSSLSKGAPPAYCPPSLKKPFNPQPKKNI